MTDYESNPDELYTIIHCYGCEQPSFIGDCPDDMGGLSAQIHCPRCGCRVNAEHIYDYAMLGGVHTDG